MAAEARISPSWAILMLIAGAALVVGLGCWCLYDGWVKYPLQERTFQEYRQEGKLDEFRVLAGKLKWKVGVHTNSEGDEYVRGPSDIATQYLMAGVHFLIGLALLTSAAACAAWASRRRFPHPGRRGKIRMRSG